METREEVVRSAEGGEWQVTMSLPETVDEALDIYGQDGVLSLFNAGLKVKLQNIARSNFKAGKSREEVETLLAQYRPGQSSRKSKKSQAAELIVQRAMDIANDPELKEKVINAFQSQDWQTVIDLLG